jgi:hypothetical protein
MLTSSRLTLAGLGLVVVTILLGTTVIPTHVTLGGGSLRCGTVLHPDRMTEIAPLCGRAASNQLRAVLVIGAILSALALIPVAVGWRLAAPPPALWGVWVAVMLVAGLLAVAAMGWAIEYAPKSAFFDL